MFSTKERITLNDDKNLSVLNKSFHYTETTKYTAYWNMSKAIRVIFSSRADVAWVMSNVNRLYVTNSST